MADAEQLMPAYLRFVKGIIDSNDLPLNVSREILQESRDVKAIREGSARRVLSMLEDLAENRKSDYVVFWREFGQVLKEGIGEDIGNQARIAGLLRFHSTVDAPVPAPAAEADSTAEKTDEAVADESQTDSADSADDNLVTLATYKARMKPAQESISYVTAETLAGARNSPLPVVGPCGAW